LAYGSTASGRAEVYVRAFDGSGSAIRVSTAGGNQPLWGPDGRRFIVNGSSLSLDEPIIVTTDWQQLLPTGD
jgi:Tol biopolymer transport system component